MGQDEHCGQDVERAVLYCVGALACGVAMLLFFLLPAPAGDASCLATEEHRICGVREAKDTRPHDVHKRGLRWQVTACFA
jgi:hypothetical protein